MKLVSMCDYTLNVVQTPNINEAICWEQTQQRLDKIYHYSLFLKQPLELWMFVPVGENGNILEEPKRRRDYLEFPESFDGNQEWYELYAYEQAKERCLFDGYEYSGETEYNWILKHNNHFPFFVIKTQKIEYLSNMTAHNITLTQTAIKQLGL